MSVTRVDVDACPALADRRYFGPRRWTNRRKSWIRSVLAFGLAAAVCANVFVTVGLTIVSAGNYPGGEVMRLLHALEANATVPGKSSCLDLKASSHADSFR